MVRSASQDLVHSFLSYTDFPAGELYPFKQAYNLARKKRISLYEFGSRPDKRASFSLISARTLTNQRRSHEAGWPDDLLLAICHLFSTKTSQIHLTASLTVQRCSIRQCSGTLQVVNIKKLSQHFSNIKRFNT